MSCNTNDRPIDIPQSILLLAPSEILDESAVEKISPSSNVDQRDLSSKHGGMINISDTSKELRPQMSVTMPLSHVVEILQTFYWPLYSKHINWIHQQSTMDSMTDKQIQEQSQRVTELLHSLEFIQSLDLEEDDADINNKSRILVENQSTSGGIVASSPSGDTITRIMEELEEEK